MHSLTKFRLNVELLLIFYYFGAGQYHSFGASSVCVFHLLRDSLKVTSVWYSISRATTENDVDWPTNYRVLPYPNLFKRISVLFLISALPSLTHVLQLNSLLG